MIKNKELMPLEEFEKLDKKTQKQLLEFWLKKHQVKEIKEELGIHNIQYYKLIESLGVEKKSYKNTKKTSYNKPSKEEKETSRIDEGKNYELELQDYTIDPFSTIKKIENVFEDKSSSFYFNIAHIGNSEAVRKKILAILDLIEDGEYNFSLTITKIK